LELGCVSAIDPDLTALEVIYEGGSLHGKTADFHTRDLERLVVGVHRRDWHFF
jgi:hypothetical protein